MTATPQPAIIWQEVEAALAEDIGNGDLTAGLIAADKQAHAHIVCRENAVVCGRPWVDEVYRQLSPAVIIDWAQDDGDAISAGARVCTLRGPARALLTGERTALNFLQLLSATATVTRQYVDAVSHTDATILDTRKTIPGLRLAQKYAVRCGGGANHRLGLYDAILIKENHIQAAGSIAAAVAHAREHGVPVEIEVESVAELDAAIAAGVDRIMLDNFELGAMTKAVQRTAGHVSLEASGSVDIAGVAALADTGVDFISIGGLTKHIRAIDYSMRFEDSEPNR